MSSSNPSTVYRPTKEEAQVVIKANSEFMKRYVLGIFLGFGSAWALLRQTGTKARSFAGFGTYFVFGLSGEYFGRQFGKARAQEELQMLPESSELRKLWKKLEKNEPIDFELELGRPPNNDAKSTIPPALYPNPSSDSGSLSDLSRTSSSNKAPTNEDFGSNTHTMPKRKNKYGDDID